MVLRLEMMQGTEMLKMKLSLKVEKILIQYYI